MVVEIPGNAGQTPCRESLGGLPDTGCSLRNAAWHRAFFEAKMESITPDS
jgi:hypothetical protein